MLIPFTINIIPKYKQNNDNNTGMTRYRFIGISSRLNIFNINFPKGVMNTNPSIRKNCALYFCTSVTITLWYKTAILEIKH